MRVTHLHPFECTLAAGDVRIVEHESAHADAFLALLEYLRREGWSLAQMDVRSDGHVWVGTPPSRWRWRRSTAEEVAEPLAGARAQAPRAQGAPMIDHRAELAILYEDDEPRRWQAFAFRSRLADPWAALLAYLQQTFGRQALAPSREGVFRVEESLGRDARMVRYYRLCRELPAVDAP